ncbi:hypothetical protein [Flavobacterium oreochromis]|uniref:hypothetical protein n=1 Tax=Flavobacterium oreochromis TaxID=2906078 RepID=UPI00385CC5B1
MIAVEECKKILLDNGDSYTDEEVKLIREFLYKAAKMTLEENNSKKLNDGEKENL